MTEAARRAILFTLRWEVGSAPNGGYVNDPDDPGGETKYGISKRAHPDVDIKNLTEQEAVEIYYYAYWKPILADALPPLLALALFDWTVHSDRRLVIRVLQRRLGGLKADGLIGRRTVNRAWEVAPTPRLAQETACKLVADRVRFLLRLTGLRPKLQKYELGWMLRTHDLTAEVFRA
jgi:lysozyme family protein